MTDSNHPWQAAAEAAVQHWNIPVAELKPISESENIVFQIRDTEGRKYVFRLHRPGYHTLEELQAEHHWINQLAEAGLDVPVPVAARSGEFYSEATCAGETRYAGIYEWVDGELLSDHMSRQPDTAAESYRELGALLARMHTVASRFVPAPSFHRHAFDAEGTMGESPFWPVFWEHETIPPRESARLNALRKALYAILLGYTKSPEIYGMIHADLHAHNIVVHGNSLHVIDFDDAGFGWYQFDIAVSLPWVNAADYETLFSALKDGYREKRSVPEDFFTNVSMFQLIRAMNSVGWRLSRYPDVTTEMLMPQLRHIFSLGDQLLSL